GIPWSPNTTRYPSSRGSIRTWTTMSRNAPFPVSSSLSPMKSARYGRTLPPGSPTSCAGFSVLETPQDKPYTLADGVVSGGSFVNISLRGFFAVALFLSVLLFSPLCPAPTDGDNASEPVPEYQNLNCNQICFVKEMMCIGERMQPHLNQYH